MKNVITRLAWGQFEASQRNEHERYNNINNHQECFPNKRWLTMHELWMWIFVYEKKTVGYLSILHLTNKIQFEQANQPSTVTVTHSRKPYVS